jgi:hypothetical protein
VDKFNAVKVREEGRIRKQNNGAINPLMPNGNYMNHLRWQSVMLHFVFIGFAWFSL